MVGLRISVAALGLTLGLSGCPTSFSGNAHIVNGRVGCEQKCKQSKLRMSALVFLGEYSSACVCELPPPKASSETPPVAPPEAPASGAPAAAASFGGAVGAMLHAAADPEAQPPALRWK
jgi:hypothetical protein